MTVYSSVVRRRQYPKGRRGGSRLSRPPGPRSPPAPWTGRVDAGSPGIVAGRTAAPGHMGHRPPSGCRRRTDPAAGSRPRSANSPAAPPGLPAAMVEPSRPCRLPSDTLGVPAYHTSPPRALPQGLTVPRTRRRLDGLSRPAPDRRERLAHLRAGPPSALYSPVRPSSVVDVALAPTPPAGHRRARRAESARVILPAPVLLRPGGGRQQHVGRLGQRCRQNILHDPEPS